MASSDREYSLFTSDMERNILIQSNYLTWSIVCSYIAFTKVIGPIMMRDRKPFELKHLILAYNVVLVLSNIYMCVKGSISSFELLPYRCDIPNSPLEIRMAIELLKWKVLCLKFAELLDTVFFILRKKNNQVSFLHVFHHTIVCVLFWIGIRNKYQGYYQLMIGTVNCGVHVILYLYYALSALGPEVRKYLWWKKHLTTLQIMQFFVLMIYMIFGFASGCEKPGPFEKIVFGGLVSITLLFFNFYYRTYNQKKIK